MTSASAPRLLHEVFARSARQHPARIAVDVPPSAARPSRVTRTYAEIDADASRVAACLGPERSERVVALLLGRHDPWLYACQLGVQRAGAAWVGLDARHPDAALRFVLEDAAVVEAFSDAEGAARLRSLGVPGLVVHEVEALQDAASPAAFEGGDDRLAYVIYTSGTTGRPKGVLIEHRSAVTLVLGDVVEFGLGPDDRVAQGSSPAYDSSVEEVWLAWAVGGTVVPLDDDVVRSGPDLLTWLRDERVTVLCPPPTLLRTLGSRDPERDLPDLRLLYVGGEALDPDLADLWSRGRRMVNGYGPTECTVTVTRAEVVAGRAVTIGAAVPGSRALVLDEALEPVADGEEGELCIAGRSLARGYLGRPELTAERFVDHPSHGRIYRTGDLARFDGAGQLVYGGRRDTQVKLRGHRVELGEIESRMVGRCGVSAAACVVGEDGLLRAFVVGDVDVDQLRAALVVQLPPHMIPAVIERTGALPTTVGGKLDRRALAARATAGEAARAEPVAPADGVEGILSRAFAAALGRAGGVGPDVDFFEAGGDSVRAAVLVSALREVPDTASLTVRDVYEARTVRGLAARARPAVEPAVARSVGVDPQWRTPVVLAQTLWILLEATCAVALVTFTFFELLPLWLRWVGPGLGLALLPAVGAAARALWWAPATLLAALSKRLLIGRYRAGRWPVRGWYHFRHWVVVRLARLVPHGLVQGTELQAVTLRALGAQVGRGVHLARGVDVAHGGWDLLDLGDGAVVERDGALELCVLDAGQLVVGEVTVGRDAVVGVRGAVGSGARLGDGAHVTALSRIGAGGEVPPGDRWTGVPARPDGRAVAGPAPGAPGLGVWPHALLCVAVRVAGGAFGPVLGMLGLLFAASFFGVTPGDVEAFVGDPGLSFGLGYGVFVCLAVVVPLVLALQALALRFGPKCPAGVHPLRSARQILADERMRSVEAAGIWLSGTLFWPMWLRLAGARVGSASEVSTIMDVLPEHLTIGGRSFFADGIYLGGPSRGRGAFEVRPVAIGDGTFFGNHVVVPNGVSLPDGILVGVSTVADPATIREGTSWFGHPAFELPRREIVTVDERLTFRPGALRYVNRVFWELGRFAIPGAGSLLALGWVVGAGGGVDLARLALASATWASASALLILVLKWALLGRVRPGQHGLWSCWCSRWDFLYVAWGMLARPVLARLDGTPWLAAYLRAMGLSIGRNVVLGPGFAQVVDPDMIEIGDGATVDTMFQAHSFEDRVLKIDRVRIGAGATVGRASVLLYGIDIGDGARVAGHSVVMKRERLLPGRRYVGVPTREVDA